MGRARRSMLWKHTRAQGGWRVQRSAGQTHGRPSAAGCATMMRRRTHAGVARLPGGRDSTIPGLQGGECGGQRLTAIHSVRLRRRMRLAGSMSAGRCPTGVHLGRGGVRYLVGHEHVVVRRQQRAFRRCTSRHGWHVWIRRAAAATGRGAGRRRPFVHIFTSSRKAAGVRRASWRRTAVTSGAPSTSQTALAHTRARARRHRAALLGQGCLPCCQCHG